MRDLRLALRMIGRQPMTSTLAVVALALGIGLTTLMFSILNGAVLRGLPLERSERILHASRITPDMFRMLRTTPTLGRDFRDANGAAGAEPVVIVSDRLWRDRFGGRPDALGQSLRVNGTAMTVVGVMPPGFAYPVVQELWAVLFVNPALEGKDTRPTLEVIGRLRDGLTRDQASAELATIAAQVAADDPARRSGITVEVKPYIEEFIGSETVSLLSVMLAAVMLVLVIACVNAANLVLARAVSRTREMAVRTALGARRAQDIRQMLLEVGVLAVAGAAVGVAIAEAGTRFFTRAVADTAPPFWIDVRVDGTVLAFAVATTALAALVAGLVPALKATRVDVAPRLNDEGRDTTSLTIGRLSRGLVVGEVALSFALLVVSGLVIQSILNVTWFDPGIATHDVLSARLTLPAAEYPDDGSRARFAERLLQHVYLPLAQWPSQGMTVLVRAAGDPLALTTAVRQSVAALDRNLPIYNVMTVERMLADGTWVWRIFGSLFSVFGVAALFLATVGIYGVMAFSVSKRTQEFGVRLAVGAESGDVWRMVLLVTGLAAVAVPARRASRIDPMVALRG